jgi:hypothetical protein
MRATSIPRTQTAFVLASGFIKRGRKTTKKYSLMSLKGGGGGGLPEMETAEWSGAVD